MIHLRSVSLKKILPSQARQFPFNIPIVRGMEPIEFKQPVTFLVGENGSGKSTLIEAIAYAAQAQTIGSTTIDRDKTLDAIRPLAKALRLVWNKRTRNGFFLRAEDFFGFVKRINQTRTDLQRERSEIEAEFKDSSTFARGLAMGPVNKELGALQRRYGDGLDTMSHGESFLKLFQSRFVPKGLYLLDEPETPLSPLRQLALIGQIKEMVAQECQFIIATHSPILMAYPNAHILQLEEGSMRSVAYDDLEHVRLTRDFLNDPQQFLRYL